jgi:hypothetical protein
MPSGTSVYRALIWLYPNEFRLHYRDDLVVHFNDLVERYGPVGAWRRTAVDLFVTVPRYRLESVMNTHRTAAAFVAIITMLVIAAIGTVATGIVPLALIAMVLAGALALAERSRLARSLRPAAPADRKRILLWASALATGCVLSMIVGLIDLAGRDSWPPGRLLVYNAAFITTGIAALACLAVAWRRPRIATSGSSPLGRDRR